ncbi:MAG: EamA family transporter [Nannocystaceae bacterium]|nr:DMT family transporter [bacterium]
MSADPSLGIGLTVGSALCWAGLDASRKILVRSLSPVALLVLLTLGQLPLFLAWAVSAGDTITSADYVAPAVASLVLNIVANLAFFRAVTVSALSLTVPLLAFVPVFTTIAANPLLGELPGAQQIAGIGVVVVGALTLNAGSAEGGGPLAFVRALFRERGSLPMLVTALCWSLTIVVDKLATEHAGYGIHGAVLNAGLGGFGLALLAIRGRLGDLAGIKKAWKPWLFSITLGAAGLGTQLIAVQHLFAALVEAGKRAIGVTMSVVVGRLAFGEPITRYKVAAVVLMSIGAGLIVWK